MSQKTDQELVRRLAERARRLRVSVLEMIYRAQSGHPGGSLSAAEILVTLYEHELRVDPKNPRWPDRDRFVLAKGHAAPALYVELAERGFFLKSELERFRQIDSILQGHPDMKKTPGVDMSTGSLGQGLSVGIGMALAARLDQKDYHVWALLGDGELDEGQVWEAAAYASFHKLTNITAIVDLNHVQLDGSTREVLAMDPVAEKWRAFGWRVIECDGHSVEELLGSYAAAKGEKSGPTVILARTVKGKGVSFMENNAAWHGAAPTEEQFQQAMVELKQSAAAEQTTKPGRDN
ncbi:MAG: transketolase [Firmicutes bacterium]|nr:transketolase [Bacillota bacterium]